MQGKLLYAVIGLVIGAFIGFFSSNALNRSEAKRQNDAISAASSAVSADVSSQAIDQVIARAESEPQNFAAQMQAGDMYAQIGRFEKAIEFYKRGLILNPENVQANVVLANALFDSRKFEEAEGYYSKALSLDDKNVNARIDLGTTFVERAQPDYDRAIKEFSAALDIDPTSEPAIYYLGIAYLRKGDRGEAEKRLAKLAEINPESPLVGRLRQNIESAN